MFTSVGLDSLQKKPALVAHDINRIFTCGRSKVDRTAEVADFGDLSVTQPRTGARTRTATFTQDRQQGRNKTVQNDRDKRAATGARGLCTALARLATTVCHIPMCGVNEVHTRPPYYSP